MNFEPDAPPQIVRQPLYRQVKQHILGSLTRKNPGDRLPTEAEYVKVFGVSITTVRHVLRELTHEGWIEKRQGSGTFLRDVRHRENRHVAVLLDVDISSDNLQPFWLKFTRAIKKALKAQGMPARLYYGDLPLGIEATGLTCEDLLEDVRRNRVGGLISFFTRRAPEWRDLLKSKNIPVIDPEYYRIDHLNVKREQEFLHAAFQHFVERGRKHIALLIWESPTDGLNFFSKSFLSLAAEYDIRVNTHLMDITANGWERGMGWERFRDMWHSKKERPDGIIIGDDALFEDCQKAILELGISVPEELDVVAYSSDAVELTPQFPIYNWKTLMKERAKIYAREMKALMENEPPPVFASWPHIVELPEFAGEGADAEYVSLHEILQN